MVSVPAPLLFQYMERSTRIFLREVRQRTTIPAFVSSEKASPMWNDLRELALTAAASVTDPALLPVRYWISIVTSTGLGFWTSVQVSQPRPVWPSGR